MSSKPLLHAGFSLGGIISRTLSPCVESRFAPGTHEFWMEHALLISMQAVGWSAPNPAVGCVVVRQDQKLAEGFTQAFGKEHAERMAFEFLSHEELERATVYVTLEPCSHFGAQPPCVDLLAKSPVETVVIACVDPDLRVNGRGIQKLKDAGKKVVVGVLENEAKAWHFPFLHTRGERRVVWIGKWAETHDRYLADADGNSKWITNQWSRAYTHWLRQKYDAILVGAKTWLQDAPQLTVRDCATPHRRNPHRLVFDPKGQLLDLRNRVSETIYAAPIHIYVVEEFLAVIPATLQVDGLNWIPIPCSLSDPNLISVFKETVEKTQFNRPLQSVFCEGGASMLRLLIDENGLDAVHRFTALKQFSLKSDRYRMPLEPFLNWHFLAEHNFDGDHLREWVKCF